MRSLVVIVVAFAGAAAPMEAAACEQPEMHAGVAAATDLLELRAAEYILRREVLLAEPDEQFGRGLALLRTRAGCHQAASIAAALEVRRRQPDVAAEFEAMVARAWEAARIDMMGTRRPVFGAANEDLARYRPLVVEFLLKQTDSPPQLRQAAIALLAPAQPPDGAGLTGLLALLEAAEQFEFSFEYLAGCAAKWEHATRDDRIPAALAAGFNAYRDRFPEDPETARQAALHLRGMQAPAACDAARRMVDSERARMLRDGMSPRDYSGRVTDLRSVVRLTEPLREELRAEFARGRSVPEADRPVIFAAADLRFYREGLWLWLNWIVIELDARLEEQRRK